MAVEFRRNLAIWRQVHDEEGSLDDAKFAIGCCRFRVRNCWRETRQVGAFPRIGRRRSADWRTAPRWM